MKVSRTDILTQAFVLTGEDLQALLSRLKNFVSKIEFEIKCKDSLKRGFSTVEALLDFVNPPNKDILSLRIVGHSDDLKTRVWVNLENDTSRNIFLSIEGDEEAAMSMNESIEETFSAIRPWYSLLARTDFYLLLLALMFLPGLIVIVAFAVGIVKINPGQPFSLGSDLPGIFRGFLLGLIPLVFGVVLNRIKRSVFPIGVFAIGQGVKRHKDKEILRTVVVVAFFVSLASSIMATLLFAFWP